MTENREKTIMDVAVIVPEMPEHFDGTTWWSAGCSSKNNPEDFADSQFTLDNFKQWPALAQVQCCSVAIVYFEEKTLMLEKERQECIHETRGIINPERFSSIAIVLREEIEKAEAWRRLWRKVRAAR